MGFGFRAGYAVHFDEPRVLLQRCGVVTSSALGIPMDWNAD
jgi:hypothetical protein